MLHLRWPRVAVALTALLLGTPLLLAQSPARTAVDVDRLGPQVGERVPDFRLPDQHGRVRTLADVVGPKGALIMFYRSADW